MPLDRYKFARITFDSKNKRRFFQTNLYPEIKPRPNDLIILSKDGDRLDVLAQRFYGDSALWWIIARANNIGKGTYVIEPGLRLRIPQNINEIFSKLDQFQRTR